MSEETKTGEVHRSGFVGIIGRPNAGKSTLFNRLLGQKLSIITHKAQTTRHRIPGFYSDDTCQIVFLDTPGIIQPAYLLQEKMMDKVLRLRNDADLLVHMVDGRRPPDADDVVWETLAQLKLPVILAVNKADLLGGQDSAEEVIGICRERFEYVDALAISALDGSGVDALVALIRDRLPPGPAFYPKDQASDLTMRFFVSELIREQLFLLYEKEVPYSCAVNVVEYREEDDIDHIDAEIVVSRNSQKGILIGKKGAHLKELGIRSRKEIEQLTGKQANLKLFVKVREKWREKENFLKSYGYR
ncbi:MAG: GTPase Era [Balneolaceae bacterium]|nr:MAG: GTPase Era [Balneolaceae bacterium]